MKRGVAKPNWQLIVHSLPERWTTERVVRIVGRHCVAAGETITVFQFGNRHGARAAARRVNARRGMRGGVYEYPRWALEVKYIGTGRPSPFSDPALASIVGRKASVLSGRPGSLEYGRCFQFAEKSEAERALRRVRAPNGGKLLSAELVRGGKQ